MNKFGEINAQLSLPGRWETKAPSPHRDDAGATSILTENAVVSQNVFNIGQDRRCNFFFADIA